MAIPRPASLLQMPPSAPIWWRSAGYFNSSQPQDRDEELQAVARETTGRFLGPISVNDFFELMPVTDGNGPPDIDSIHFNAVRNTKGEKHMYTKPLVRFTSDFALALALIHFSIRWMP